MYKLLFCCFVVSLSAYSMETAAPAQINQVETMKFELRELEVRFFNIRAGIAQLRQPKRRETAIRKWRRERAQQKLAAQQQKTRENERLNNE